MDHNLSAKTNNKATLDESAQDIHAQIKIHSLSEYNHTIVSSDHIICDPQQTTI
jgi:hypothetical protein